MKANGTGHSSELLGTDKRGKFGDWPMIIGWSAMLIFAFHACTHMVAAGDTWVAMACGRHFTNHQVDTVEPFSANSHKAGPTAEEVAKWPGWAQRITKTVGLDTVRKWHPTGWINQNWLTHEIFYRLATTFGSEEEPCYNALIVWKFSIYILAVLCIYHTGRLLGVDPLLAALVSCFAMFLGRSFIDVRPAGFSNLLVAVFLLILTLASYRNALYIWLIVPLVAFWSNVHGGYLYAFMALTPFVGWHLMMRLPKRWTVALYSIVTWLVLYGLTHQFLQHMADMINKYLPHERAVPPVLGDDWMLVFLLLAIGGSIAAACYRRLSDSALTSLHVTVSCLVFLLLLVRYFPVLPGNLNPQGEKIFGDAAASGRLIYLGIFSLALFLGAVMVSLRDKAVRVLEFRAIGHVVGAGAVAFAAMVIFNPFHLTNLTHTFIISFSEHAERWRDVHEWHAAFDWTNPVGTAIPFLVMYLIAWLSLIGWAVVSIWSVLQANQLSKKQAEVSKELAGPKIDLALLIVAAMTVYMAIRSRRFIPIAGYAACPIIALLIQRMVASLLILTHLRHGLTWASDRRRMVAPALMLGVGGALVVLGFWRGLFWEWLFLPVPGHPTLSQPRTWLTTLGVVLAFSAFPLSALFYISKRRKDAGEGNGATERSFVGWAWWNAAVGLCAAVLGFGLWVGLRFDLVYLDYWPADSKLTSIFMRMTASDAKPFYACQFMRDNQLSGKMFNYWTEGGFIAYGQEPDPNTGRTPLQLFMDGRAQAAYDTDTFDLWTNITAGGTIGRTIAKRAAASGRGLTMQEYIKIGAWLSEQLRKYEVWVVLMPNNQFDKPLVQGLTYDANWRIVFMNNKQKMFVDVKSDKGRQLYEGMFSRKLVYPDEFSANLTLGHNLLEFRDPAQKRQGMELVKKAFELNPSPGPMLDMLLIAGSFPDFGREVDTFCVDYATKFEENKAEYARQDGYNHRLEAARLAMLRLERVAKAQGNTEAAATCANRMREYLLERNRISMKKRW